MRFSRSVTKTSEFSTTIAATMASELANRVRPHYHSPATGRGFCVTKEELSRKLAAIIVAE
jgi:hypothetical protein